MWQYIVGRLVWIPFLLIAVAFITFILGRFGPGDPVEVMMGTKYDALVSERIRYYNFEGDSISDDELYINKVKINKKKIRFFFF